MGTASRRTDATRQTGVVRHIDELGRVVIPVEIRKRLRIAERDPLEISVRGDTVILSKPRETCVFCGASRALLEYRGRHVCEACRNALADSPPATEASTAAS